MTHQDETGPDPKEQSYHHQGGCPHPKDELLIHDEENVPVEVEESVTFIAQCEQCGDILEVEYELSRILWKNEG